MKKELTKDVIVDRLFSMAELEWEQRNMIVTKSTESTFFITQAKGPYVGKKYRVTVSEVL